MIRQCYTINMHLKFMYVVLTSIIHNSLHHLMICTFLHNKNIKKMFKLQEYEIVQ